MLVVKNRKIYIAAVTQGINGVLAMKHKTSVALDGETLTAMRELVRNGLFRNKSHVMEYAVRKLLEERQNGNGL